MSNRMFYDFFLLKVSGWGVNERGAPNDKLMTTNLQFVSRKRCSTLVPSDFKPFVTFDKFCAVVEGDRQGMLSSIKLKL